MQLFKDISRTDIIIMHAGMRIVPLYNSRTMNKKNQLLLPHFLKHYVENNNKTFAYLARGTFYYTLALHKWVVVSPLW